MRSENCDFGERQKFLKSKLAKCTSEKDELEKELRLVSRKNKAFSFLPGQSTREEMMKLQDENEHLNQALEKQKVDFQWHDQALRDEISLLQKQVQMAQNSTKKTIETGFQRWIDLRRPLRLPRSIRVVCSGRCLAESVFEFALSQYL